MSSDMKFITTNVLIFLYVYMYIKCIHFSLFSDPSQQTRIFQTVGLKHLKFLLLCDQI